MFVNDDYCYSCNKKTQHVNGRCSECQKKIDDEKEQKWKALSNEEKIEALRQSIISIQNENRIY